MCYHILEVLRGIVPRNDSLGDVEGMTHTHTYALTAHLMTARPRPPKPPTQTEQFVDAPPKDMYVNDWRKHVKQKQENKHDTKHPTNVP